MNRRALALLLSSAAFVGPIVKAESKNDDAKAILVKAGQAYEALRAFDFEGRSISESTIAAKTSKSEVDFTVAFQSPNKMRLEFRYPSAGSWVRVSDGEYSLVMRTLTKESRRVPISDRTMQTLSSSPIYSMENLAESAENPRLLSPEAIEVGGRHYNCNVIRFSPHRMTLSPGEAGGTSTVWVDQDSGLVLRQETRTSGENGSQGRRIIEIDRFQLNGELAAELFSTRPHHSEGAFNRK